MKSKILLFIGLILFQFGYSQNARSILDKASAAYTKANGMKVNFTIESKDGQSASNYTQSGEIKMKGNKFRIETPDGITWFDGKTQWVYAHDSGEVDISTPTGNDLAAVSPAFVLNMYKSGFTLNYKGTKQERGKLVYIVELVSQKRNANTKFTLAVDKTNYLLSSVVITEGSSNVHLSINRMQSGLSLPSSTFIFNKAEYPKLEVVDLR